MKARLSLVSLFVIAWPALVQSAEPTPTPPGYLSRAKRLLTDFDRDRMLAEVKELYDQAKAAGETAQADLVAWVKEDLARVGAWEYRVARLPARDSERLQKELNALGTDRWECLSVTPAGSDLVLVLKRPVRSYLGHLNVRDVLRVLPEGN